MDVVTLFKELGLLGGVIAFFLLMFRFVMVSYRGLVNRIMLENEQREQRYISVINKLSDSFEGLAREFHDFRQDFERRRKV